MAGLFLSTGVSLMTVFEAERAAGSAGGANVVLLSIRVRFTLVTMGQAS